MSILDWLAKNKKTVPKGEKLSVPEDLWVKCFSCNDILFLKDLEQNQKVCEKCNYHFRINPQERIKYTLDNDSFVELEGQIGPVDFLKFEDTEKYADRINKAKKKSEANEAVIVGSGTIKKIPINIGIMNFSYMGGSMGSVVGEKITRIIEKSAVDKKPLVIFTASGGARMQEGILSLMQMAKTSGALNRLADQGIPYISVLSDPTTGGTSASFAMLGDINIAEPGALISFAGPRVIEQTIRQKLPKGFQRSEFLLEHGMVDMVVDRKNMREKLGCLLKILNPHGGGQQK